MKRATLTKNIPIILLVLCVILIAIPFTIDWYANTYYIGVAYTGKDLEAEELAFVWMTIAELAVILSFVYCLISSLITRSKQSIISTLILAIPNGFLAWTYINMKLIEYYLFK